MSSVVKVGPWGVEGPMAGDITVAPQRLESISICWDKVVDSIAFTYSLQGPGEAAARRRPLGRHRRRKGGSGHAMFPLK
ncbi:hypothetical protein ACP70R_048983 [Stipagrostis hirtigluma subsp. patula]